MQGMSLRITLMLAAMAALAACKTSGTPTLDSSGAAANPDNDPVGAITKVSQVKVTPEINDVVQFRGSSSKAFTYDHLKAVLYCRAWQHAGANGFAGGYPLRFHKLEGVNVDSALVVIASVQMYEGANTSGKSALDQSWCTKVPRAAQ